MEVYRCEHKAQCFDFCQEASLLATGIGNSVIVYAMQAKPSATEFAIEYQAELPAIVDFVLFFKLQATAAVCLVVSTSPLTL